MDITQKMIQTADDFRTFDVGTVLSEIKNGNFIPPEEIIRWLDLVQGYWMFDHNGDPARPHALLTSGKHSDGYVNCPKLLQYPKALNILAVQLVEKFRRSEFYEDFSNMYRAPDIVFGSAYSAITFSEALAYQYNARHGFTEKTDDGMKIKQGDIFPGDQILLVEELITTFKTTNKQVAAIKKEMAERSQLQPLLMVFVNRTGQKIYKAYYDWPIVSLLEVDIQNWDTKDDCPLCQNGSKAIPPKANWAQLTGK